MKFSGAFVHQISLSSGGVPKRAVREAVVTSDGLQGDQQRDLKHHGGPERAICLFSLERIQALQGEGHPVFPGALGENLTLSGLNWENLGEGTHLQIGDEVKLEVTRHTTPCSNLRPYFLDGDYSRVSQKLHPGWSRLYARVLKDGKIQVGDPVLWIK